MSGRVAPQADPNWAALLRRTLEATADLVETTSRFGAAGRLAWRAGGREIAHLHSPPLVDIRLPKEVRKTYAADPRLVPRPGRSEWIECRMETPADAEFVAQLIRCAAGGALSSRSR